MGDFSYSIFNVQHSPEPISHPDFSFGLMRLDMGNNLIGRLAALVGR